MISPFNSAKNDWNEIVFEDRHKTYGAYLLRRDYDLRLLKSFFITFGSLLLLVASVLISSSFRDPVIPFVPHNDTIVINPVYRPVPPPSDPEPSGPKRKATEPDRATPPGVPVPDPSPDPSPEPLPDPVPGTPGTPATPGSGSNTSDTATGGSGTGTSPEVHDYVDTFPEFPGGEKELHRFIRDHLRTDRAKDAGLERTKIMVSFIIDPEGNVTEVRILSRNGYGLEDEARSVFNKMPKWKPGKNHSKKVHVRFILPIHLVFD